MSRTLYPLRLLILDGYTAILKETGRVAFSNSFSGFYFRMGELFESVSVALPHLDEAGGCKLNVATQDGIKYYLLPYFSDPIDFFRRLPMNIIATARGLWRSLDDCDACLLRFPSPVLPLLYLMARLRRRKIVLFVMGSWLETTGNLPSGLGSIVKKSAVWLFERFHVYIIRRHPTISTYPYLDSGFKDLSFAFYSPVDQGDFVDFTRCGQEGRSGILFVGRLTEAKGVFVLLDAYREMLREGISHPLHMAGEGYLMGDVRRYIEKHNIADSVVLHGHMGWKDLRTLYRKSYLFVLPSFTEGMPKVVLEAMSQCAAVVSTRIGALPILFRDGEHCLFVDPGDSAQLKNAMKRLVLDPGLSKNIAVNAYTICKNYTSGPTAENIARLIAKACGADREK